MTKLFKANYTGPAGIYRNEEYVLNIGHIEGRIVIKRKCGAGKVYYTDINDFLNNWNNIRKV